jgi:hypothetical protein
LPARGSRFAGQLFKTVNFFVRTFMSTEHHRLFHRRCTAMALETAFSSKTRYILAVATAAVVVSLLVMPVAHAQGKTELRIGYQNVSACWCCKKPRAR